MNCFSVQILEIPLGTPSHFLTNGLLFLDLFEGTSSPVSIKAPALRFGKISDTAALGFAVPKTEKNKYLLQHFTNPAVSRGQAESLQVVAMQGGEALRQDRLQVVGGSHRRGEKKYEIQLLRSASHWITGAQNLLLSDLDFDNFNFTGNNVKSVQANNSVFDASDTDAGIYFPAVNYGRFAEPFNHVTEDFRVWHHATAIIERGLCELGWGLDSAILYSDYGRRIITYLADSNYGNTEALKTARQFRATILEENPSVDGVFDATIGYFIFNRLLLPDESFDNGNNYNSTTGFYTGIGIHNFTAAFEFTGTSPDSDNLTKITVRINKTRTDGSILLLGENFATLPAGNTPGTISIETQVSGITVRTGENVFVALSAINGDVQPGFGQPTPPTNITLAQGAFFNETTRTNYIAGDLIQISDTIDPTMTFLEFLKGIVHLFNFRIDTNFNTKQVGLYPPFSTQGFHGSNYLGFYKELSQAVDYSEIVECESAVAELEELSRKRYYSLRYANNSDAYAESRLGEEEAKKIHSKTIDFGERYLPETETDENPLFAASLSAEVNRTANKFRQSLDMLHLLDNLDNADSFDVGFRIALAFGDKDVRKVMPDGSLGIPGFRFDGVESPIPYAAMRTDYVSSDGSPLLQNLIYGEDLKTNNDLYSWFYKKDIVSRFNNLKISLRLFLNADKLAAFSIRNFAYLVADGVPFFARAEEVIDADRCSDLATEIIWIPEAALLDECVEDYDLPVGRCTDNPTVQVATTQSQTERCATPTIGGEQGATSSEVLEYSTDGGETWTPTTPGAQVCFSTDQQTALFRYTAQYQKGECRSRSVVEFVNFGSDCNNLPEISVTYDAPTNSISAVGSGTIGSSISNEVWTVTVGGGTSQTYAPGDVISNIGLQTVTFTRALVFADSCPDEVVTASYTPVPPECGNNPTIICNENGGFLTFTVGGLHVSEIYGIDFLVSEGGGDFVPWYGDPIACGDDVTVRAIVTYCDTCPPVCIEKVCECVNCESTFVFGQPAQFSVCG